MLPVFIFAKNFTACNRLCIRINDFLPVRLIAIQIPVQINAADMHRKDIARLIGFCQFNPVLRLVRFGAYNSRSIISAADAIAKL